MMMMSTGRNSSSSSYPFTPTQWQELEHQALIYKYMASGIPIPSDLLLPIRRSFFLNSTTPNLPPPHFPQPTIGWGCFHQRGYGRKAEDPEPGRCRRTDGKKWRCAKEAYPDSKYCERHMHRGKNRSRKPVEISLNTTPPTANSNYPSTSSSSSSSSSNTNTTTTTATNTCSLFSSTTPSYDLPLSISAPDQSSYYPYNQLHYPTHNLYTTTENSERDYNRFCQGMKDVDEYTFFSETTTGDGRGNSWQLRPLGLGEPKQSTEYSKEEKEKEKHCFVLGADFKLGTSGKEREEENQKTLRHFFDEWPQKGRDSWMGLEGESSKTQLSISIPMGLHDFPHWFTSPSSSSSY